MSSIVKSSKKRDRAPAGRRVPGQNLAGPEACIDYQ